MHVSKFREEIPCGWSVTRALLIEHVSEANMHIFINSSGYLGRGNPTRAMFAVENTRMTKSSNSQLRISHGVCLHKIVVKKKSLLLAWRWNMPVGWPWRQILSVARLTDNNIFLFQDLHQRPFCSGKFYMWCISNYMYFIFMLQKYYFCYRYA